jgi:hypothetical protein
MGKSSESCSIEIDGKRLVVRAEGIDTHVELATAKEKRVKEVPLCDIGLRRVISIERLPLGDISYLIKDKDSLSLAFGCLCNETRTGFMIHNVLLSF